VRRIPVAIAAALAIATAGCSSSGGHSKATNGAGSSGAGTPVSTPASTPATTSASAPATSPSTPATSSAPVTTAQLSAALLAPSDLGAGFAQRAFTRNRNPLPCAAAGSPSFDDQAPTDLVAGTDLANAAQSASVSEELRLYPDSAGASAALRIGTAGLNCPAGKLYATDGTSLRVKIGKPQDVTSDIGATKATAWDTTSPQADVLFVAVQLNRALVLFSFVRDPSTDTTKLPNPLGVAKAGIQKIERS